MGTELALLRGINVGGNNKIAMPRLRTVFEGLGCREVRTYINTGNVIYRGSPGVDSIEAAIAETFDLDIPVVVRDRDAIRQVEDALPETWVNDSEMKCDVMFLWRDVDDPAVLDRLTIRDDIDEVRYVPGAVLWKVDREAVTRSGMQKLVGTKLYRSMTIRNCNTVRKLAALMDED